VERNSITHSAVISAYEKGGEWARALQLVGAMVQGRAERKTITYNAAISACEQGGEWARALEVLGAMAQG
jgi:pentatricopeptide repeat domain-containing protein 1